MKTANAEDLRSKSEDELKKLLIDTKKEQFNLRFQQTGGQLERVSGIRNARRNVARIKTVLNEKKNPAAAKAAKPAKAKAQGTKTKTETTAKAAKKPAKAKKDAA
jgi:large subunit ribosomal protein L29